MIRFTIVVFFFALAQGAWAADDCDTGGQPSSPNHGTSSNQGYSSTNQGYSTTNQGYSATGQGAIPAGLSERDANYLIQQRYQNVDADTLIQEDPSTASHGHGHGQTVVQSQAVAAVQEFNAPGSEDVARLTLEDEVRKGNLKPEEVEPLLKKIQPALEMAAAGREDAAIELLINSPIGSNIEIDSRNRTQTKASDSPKASSDPAPSASPSPDAAQSDPAPPTTIASAPVSETSPDLLFRGASEPGDVAKVVSKSEASEETGQGKGSSELASPSGEGSLMMTGNAEIAENGPEAPGGFNILISPLPQSRVAQFVSRVVNGIKNQIMAPQARATTASSAKLSGFSALKYVRPVISAFTLPHFSIPSEGAGTDEETTPGGWLGTLIRCAVGALLVSAGLLAMRRYRLLERDRRTVTTETRETP